MKTNRRKQWGVISAAPTKLHPFKGAELKKVISEVVGKWIDEHNCTMIYSTKNPLLFYSRSEAEKRARQCDKENDFWKHEPKKFNPNINQNGLKK